MNDSPREILISLIVIILSITLHEFGHAYSADRLGDPTPRQQGRVTLWPDKHFDLLGFIMIVITTITGFGIGWGKPVIVDSRYHKNVRRDDIIITLCGPLMNLLLALVFGLILRFAIHSGNAEMIRGNLFFEFAWSFLLINTSLMFFNLLPIFPLDGSHIVRRLLPVELGERFYRFNMQYGPLILLVAIVSGTRIIGTIISPAITSFIMLILGLPR
jgi:Zn-dependent protease